jgi:addiction module RelE/StbE family toxin
MKINYHRDFKKNFRKRISPHENLVKRFEERLKLFLKDPKNPILQDHALVGKRINLRAFSVTGDIRVVYLIKGNELYLLDIGTHSQVY